MQKLVQYLFSTIVVLWMLNGISALADGAFRLDVDAREVREKLFAFALGDLAVGDRAYIGTEPGNICQASDATLRLLGDVLVVKPGQHNDYWQVTIKSGRRASLTYLPSPNTANRSDDYTQALVPLANPVRCAEVMHFYDLEVAALISISEIDGKANLAALVEGVLDGDVLWASKYPGEGKTYAAQTSVARISSALDLFRLHVGHYPSEEEGLRALIEAPEGASVWNGPYLKSVSVLLDLKSAGVLRDPWGREYVYRLPGKHGSFDLYSLGADGREGGEGESRDVTNW